MKDSNVGQEIKMPFPEEYCWSEQLEKVREERVRVEGERDERER